jgi:hypothetical protein
MVVNGEPRTAIEVVEGVEVHRFGEGLSSVEQQWLVQEINRRLEEAAGGELDLGALPAPSAPRVVENADDRGRFGDRDYRDRD